MSVCSVLASTIGPVTGWLGILASALQVWGTWQMANILVTVQRHKLGYVLRSVFTPSKLKGEMETGLNLNADKKLLSLRGLAFILLGFSLDVVCKTINLCFVPQ